MTLEERRYRLLFLRMQREYAKKANSSDIRLLGQNLARREEEWLNNAREAGGQPLAETICDRTRVTKLMDEFLWRLDRHYLTVKLYGGD